MVSAGPQEQFTYQQYSNKGMPYTVLKIGLLDTS
jgi:hypothetical protein